MNEAEERLKRGLDALDAFEEACKAALEASGRDQLEEILREVADKRRASRA